VNAWPPYCYIGDPLRWVCPRLKAYDWYLLLDAGAWQMSAHNIWDAPPVVYVVLCTLYNAMHRSVRSKGGKSMNKLQVMGRDGHRELLWDPKQVEAEDPEALAVIAEAERIVEEALARGQAVFRVDAPDQPAERIERFDQTAPQTVIVPRLAGG
jgi:hypothetical protein